MKCRLISFFKLFLFLFIFVLWNRANSQEIDTILFKMSLEELGNITIKSASNIEEKLSDAPATMIVITKDEIEQRGYTEASQIFDDLPGMDVVRAYGDSYFK